MYFFHYFLGGGGVCKTKTFPDRCGAGEILEKIPSMGEAWIFSGTTQLVLLNIVSFYRHTCICRCMQEHIYVCQY